MTANKPAPRHATSDWMHDEHGELLIGGLPVSQLAALVGSTPFFAYDRIRITNRVAQLRAVLPPALQLHYAIKANPFVPVVQWMARQVDGLDVASAGELLIARSTDCPVSEISFAGPGKRDAELRQAVAAGVCINLESEREIAPVAAAGEALGVTPRVAIRVNPDFELKSSGMKMTGGAKPFGIDSERVPAALARIGELRLAFQGFHLFTGSQNLNADALVTAQRKCFDLAIQLADAAPQPPAFFNLGGGFGIPYFPGEQALDLTPIGAHLARLCDEAAKRVPGTRLMLELGRYLVGEAGVYICQVVDRKVSRGETFLVTDGGLHHHLAASGNFGQVLRKNYPVAVANRMNAGHDDSVTVVGPLCTPLDLLANKVTLPQANPGDFIAIFQSGAYGPSASPARFLGHPEAREILV